MNPPDAAIRAAAATGRGEGLRAVCGPRAASAAVALTRIVASGGSLRTHYPLRDLFSPTIIRDLLDVNEGK